MTVLRIAYTPYQLRLIAPREERPEKHSPPLQSRVEAAPKKHAASITKVKQPSVDPLALPRQSISPALAARIYQANIPTEIYTYPFHIPSKHTAAVTMMHYEPGALVDCYA